jgi:hypothetical protein
MECGS